MNDGLPPSLVCNNCSVRFHFDADCTRPVCPVCGTVYRAELNFTQASKRLLKSLIMVPYGRDRLIFTEEKGEKE